MVNEYFWMLCVVLLVASTLAIGLVAPPPTITHSTNRECTLDVIRASAAKELGMNITYEKDFMGNQVYCWKVI